MQNQKAAKRYAGTFFQIALEQGQQDTVRGGLQSVAAACAGSAELREVLRSPVISPDRRQAMLRAAFAGLDKLSLDLVLFLASKGRAESLAALCEEYEVLWCDRAGVAKVTVTSADALSQTELATLQERLAARLGKKVELSTTVDVSLIAGFRARAGDQVFDYSTRTQLEQLRQRLTHA
jgi:F-type H+-transporting ATPase subunit delta